MAREFAVFSAGESWLALNVGHVREVLHAAALAVAPDNRQLEGLLNLRGHVIPVVDLLGRLGLDPLPLRPSDFLIVIQAGQRTAAVRSQQAVRLETADESSVDLSGTGELIAGTVCLDGLIASLLNVDAVLSGVDSVEM